MTRRIFLKVAATFAAILAVAPQELLSTHTKTNFQIIMEELERTNGVLEYLTFNVDKTILFDGCDGLVFRHCVFNATEKLGADSIIKLNRTQNVTIEKDCIFNGNSKSTGIIFT